MNRCANGCIIPESELDDAIEIEGGKLICNKCVNNLFPEPIHKTELPDQRGYFTGRKGRKCYNPTFGTLR